MSYLFLMQSIRALSEYTYAIEQLNSFHPIQEKANLSLQQEREREVELVHV